MTVSRHIFFHSARYLAFDTQLMLDGSSVVIEGSLIVLINESPEKTVLLL